MAKSKDLKALEFLYWKLKTENGFNTDAEFMSAWKENPVKWSDIFSVRQSLISVALNQ